MLYRFIDNIIEKHFASDKKALFLTGARQTGKTFAIRKYAKLHSMNLVEMNFLLQPEAIRVVKHAGDVKDLLLRISAYAQVPMESGKTIIFFDEIQEYGDIMTWVKALVDEGSYKVALSGSLLGVELKDIRSIPVGYMSEYKMYPLVIEEFARAVGVSDAVIGHLRESWTERKPVDDYVHEKMMQIFHLYLIVGGMPAAVQAYIDTNNLQKVAKEQLDILSLYKKDIARYDSGRTKKLYINEAFDLIPSELNAKNKRFILKRLNEHLTFSRHEEDFIWLKDADMALPVFNVAEPVFPLKLNEQRNLFKLFQNDVGLLASQYANGTQIKILSGETNLNYGAIYENAVAQELHAHGWPLFYFNSKKLGEIDFVIGDYEEGIIPVEVKSGKNYERHNALGNVLKTPNYDIRSAIVLHNDNISVKGKVTYAPVYMAMFLKKEDNADSDIIHVLDLGQLK